MFRFRSHRLIRLYSNGIQSLLMGTKHKPNVNSLAISCYSTQSDAFDVSKAVNISRNSLGILKCLKNKPQLTQT